MVAINTRNPFKDAQLNPVDGVIGEVVTWDTPKEVSLHDLRDALIQSGLDESLVPDLQYRNGFLRATKALEDRRLVRKVSDEGNRITYQLTREFFDGQEFEYDERMFVELHKDSGDLYLQGGTGAEPIGVIDTLRSQIEVEIATRRTADITAMLKRHFERHADIFPLREGGGVYFVPANFRDQCVKVADMLERIGGSLRRIDVPASGHSKQSAMLSIKEELEHFTAELQASVNEFMANTDGSERTRKALVKRLSSAEGRMLFYQHSLGQLAKTATDTLAVTRRTLTGQNDETTSDDAVAVDETDAAEETTDTETFEPMSVDDLMEMLG